MQSNTTSHDTFWAEFTLNEIFKENPKNSRPLLRPPVKVSPSPSVPPLDARNAGFPVLWSAMARPVPLLTNTELEETLLAFLGSKCLLQICINCTGNVSIVQGELPPIQMIIDQTHQRADTALPTTEESA